MSGTRRSMEEMADLARLKKEADSQPLPPDPQVLITAALDNMRQRRKCISEDVDSLELTIGTLQDGLPGDSVKYHRVTPDNIRGRLEAELFPLLQEQKRLEPARVVELQAEHSDFIRQQRSRIDASLGILYSKVAVVPLNQLLIEQQAPVSQPAKLQLEKLKPPAFDGDHTVKTTCR